MERPDQNGPWLGELGTDSDVVVSSRARLARNIAGVPFVNRATDADRNEIVGMIRRSPLFAATTGTLRWLDMSVLDPCERQQLVERHLISSQFADSLLAGGVALNDEETLSLMVNEEDHLRIQTLWPGSSLEKSHQMVQELNAELEETLDFALSQRWGFLTACPTNVGCGIRFSVMLHLPALRMTDELERVRRAAKDLDLAVRGFHGEGSESTGDFFQVSNQVTLGVSEQDLLEAFANNVVPTLVDYERSARQILMEKHRTKLEDRIHRAMGILGNARMIETSEAINLLSRIRLGVTLGIIDSTTIQTVHRLLLLVQPAHLSSSAGFDMDDEDAARIARADMIRRELGSGGVS